MRRLEAVYPLLFLNDRTMRNRGAGYFEIVAGKKGNRPKRVVIYTIYAIKINNGFHGLMANNPFAQNEIRNFNRVSRIIERLKKPDRRFHS